MQGLIFFPDISGFTNFVKSIDIDLGVSITRELLGEIIDSSPPQLELSEIEGDAVLFYKVGKPLPLNDIFAGFKKMYEAFHATYRRLKKQYGIEADLSLKLIVHYGDISIYDIKGFRKLYGQTVIESHRLLKNGSDAPNYVLITDDYFRALDQGVSDIALSDWVYSSYGSQQFSGLRKIDFHFFTYFPDEILEPLFLFGRRKKQAELRVA